MLFIIIRLTKCANHRKTATKILLNVYIKFHFKTNCFTNSSHSKYFIQTIYTEPFSENNISIIRFLFR